jgi:malonate-semialdehyde dehydrogenase (acetylating)/methylmalonate-semialdehyde dehydrogenase
VLKPSERDPSAAYKLAEWLAEAGLPEGVFNIVHGDAEAVNLLIEHPDVAAISSVSSTPVAKHIYETATKHGKRVQALGGAKNHMLVMPDADLEWSADAAIGAAFGSAGQRCMAVSVLVAVGDIADSLRDAIVDRMKVLKVGDGSLPGNEMGPVITDASRDRIVRIIGEAEGDGADVVVDGRGLSVKGCENGFFVGPTLIDGVKPGMSAYDEEVFGPVLAIVRVDTYQEAIDLINASEFANGVAIFTNDGAVARRFQHEVEVGMVGINVPIPVPMAYFSFGGWKASLFGDTHVHGMEGVRFFTRAKAITGRWPDPSRRHGVDLGFPQHS